MNKNLQNITGIVLAGGKSSRMGSNKALIMYHNKRLIEFSLDILKQLTPNILISANSAEYQQFGYPVVFDNFKNIGPIAGMEAILKFTLTDINLFLPCDSPFIKVELLLEMMPYAEQFDAVVPVSGSNDIWPLCGYYSKRITPAIMNKIEAGDFKIQNLLKIINTKYYRVADTSIFHNINTQDDLL